MECLTEKLEGKYPIGKTTVVGNEVIPIGSTGRFRSLRERFRRSATPRWIR